MLNEKSSFKNLAFCIIFVNLAWTIWTILMLRIPYPYSEPLFRAIVRISIVLFPSLIYIKFVEKQPVFETLKLCKTETYGSLIGLACFLIYPGSVFIFMLFTGAKGLQWTSSVATWLNWIVGSPFAEEVLYRGLVFRVLKKNLNLTLASIVSAALFSLLHLPWWWLSGEMEGMQLFINLSIIFLYGIFFAFLYHKTNSLWSPIVFHWLNNLFIVITK